MAPDDPQNSCGAVLCVRNRVYGGFSHTKTRKAQPGSPGGAAGRGTFWGVRAEPPKPDSILRHPVYGGFSHTKPHKAQQDRPEAASVIEACGQKQLNPP